MAVDATIFFLIGEIIGLSLNLPTLIYIFKNFDVKIHVFTMVLVDAVIANFCCSILILIDVQLLIETLPKNLVYCTLAQAAFFIPYSCGGCSTFLVATARYIMTKKSTRNIQLPPEKVSRWMLSLFLTFTFGYLSYIAINVLLDSPYAAYTEICLEHFRGPRPVSVWKIFLLQLPNLLHLFGLIFDIKLVKLVKSTIIPTNKLNTEPTPTIDDVNLQNQTTQRKNNRTVTFDENPSSQSSPIKLSNIFKIYSFNHSWDNVEKIPIQASIFSSILIFPYLFIFILTHVFELEDGNRGILNRSALTFSTAIRCPLAVMMTYKSNKRPSQAMEQEELDDFKSDERF